jgi:hypothetical protein
MILSYLLKKHHNVSIAIYRIRQDSIFNGDVG